MKQIPLTQGQFAIVDDEDYEILNKHNWCAIKKQNTFYAMRSDISGERKKNVFMHRAILGLTKSDVLVDHKDSNGLNNQKSNIRACTPSQNSQNKRKNPRSVCQYKGVYLNFKNGKFVASIRIGGKSKSLGVYNTVESAAKAYDEAAKVHFKEFARLNFPENQSEHLNAEYLKPAQNQKRLQSRNSSSFMGVSKRNNTKTFRARIMINRKEVHIGSFASAELAARAYDIFVKEHLGGNAPLNFP